MRLNYPLSCRKLNYSEKTRTVSLHELRPLTWADKTPLTHYQMTNFRLKEFADDKFKFDENGRKLSKQVENTVGKGEIARYEQFLLFPQCFQKACFPEVPKVVIVWEWVKPPLYAVLVITLGSPTTKSHTGRN